MELLRRARGQGYDGGKSALYALVQELRPEKPRPIVRFEGLPGEFSQHDFGQVDVRFVDGSVRRLHFLASRLKYSRWVQVSIVPNEQVEALVRALVDHFAAWGGLPLLAVFDRPKTIALKWSKDGRVVEWNQVFANVAMALGLGVELCWPYSPERRGAVENLVGWGKERKPGLRVGASGSGANSKEASPFTRTAPLGPARTRRQRGRFSRGHSGAGRWHQRSPFPR